MMVLAVKLWGDDMSVTEEEFGCPEENYAMRFLDLVCVHEIRS